MPTVTWVLGGTTVTFAKGAHRGPKRYDESRVLSERLAGGAICAYELGGFKAREMLDYTYPNMDKATHDAVKSFKDTACKDDLNTFTLTDNSESPAATWTVRLGAKSFVLTPEDYTDPTLPRYTLTVSHAVEPS